MVSFLELQVLEGVAIAVTLSPNVERYLSVLCMDPQFTRGFPPKTFQVLLPFMISGLCRRYGFGLRTLITFTLFCGYLMISLLTGT